MLLIRNSSPIHNDYFQFEDFFGMGSVKMNEIGCYRILSYSAMLALCRDEVVTYEKDLVSKRDKILYDLFHEMMRIFDSLIVNDEYVVGTRLSLNRLFDDDVKFECLAWNDTSNRVTSILDGDDEKSKYVDILSKYVINRPILQHRYDDENWWIKEFYLSGLNLWWYKIAPKNMGYASDEDNLNVSIKKYYIYSAPSSGTSLFIREFYNTRWVDIDQFMNFQALPVAWWRDAALYFAVEREWSKKISQVDSDIVAGSCLTYAKQCMSDGSRIVVVVKIDEDILFDRHSTYIGNDLRRGIRDWLFIQDKIKIDGCFTVGSFIEANNYVVQEEFL